MNKGKITFGTMPIGNIEDCTYNLIKNIKEADLIVVENIYFIESIIKYYNISIIAKIIDIQSLKNKEDWKTIDDEVFNNILIGKNVLCLSDEGSAIIEDPFCQMRDLAILTETKYCILPGPSSITSAISYAKFYDGGPFLFYGMLFYNKNKNKIYKDLKNNKYPSIIFYHKEIQDLFLNEIKDFIDLNKEVSLMSNLTTEYELIKNGSFLEIVKFLEKNTVSQPILIISGQKEKDDI
jgi:16S rRNA (cytidine1402-2'-O)-methyltransferase